MGVITTPDLAIDSLDPLFKPRSVAVIGASSTPTKIGGLPIAFLLAQGFAGEIYPINPKASEIQGLTAYPAIGDVAGRVDLAIIAVPAEEQPSKLFVFPSSQVSAPAITPSPQVSAALCCSPPALRKSATRARRLRPRWWNAPATPAFESLAPIVWAL